MVTDEWSIGDIVHDHYLVLDVVRRGGMGLVYRVRHLDWDIDLAVKTPLAQYTSDAFEREASTWVRLGVHPNIVACVHVRRLDGVPRVFAEWVDGGTLSELVYSGPIAVEKVLDIASQVAWGLGHAHRHGLVHQDVKPANIMLDLDGTAKVTDFGLAKARAVSDEGAPRGEQVTYAGRTREYCSPEQARAAVGEQVRLTVGTDMWSWALCVLEMFVGSRPTQYGQAAAEVFEELLISGLSMPSAVVDLLRQCFQPDPAARPSDMDEVAGVLIEAYRDITGEPYPRAQPTDTWLQADGRNNHALSLLELGDLAGAEEQWTSAASADPHHEHTVYNQGLYMWRDARITDEQLVSELRAADADPRFLEWVHQERGGRDGELTFAGHEEQVSGVALNRDGTVALSGDRKGRLLVWSPATGEIVRQLSKKGAAVAQVALDAFGRTGLVLRDDGAMEQWDLATGRMSKLVDWNLPAATRIAISSDGKRGVTGHLNGKLRVWDLTDGAQVGYPDGHRGRITALALSSDGQYVLSASFDRYDASVVLWYAISGKAIGRLDAHDGKRFGELDFAILTPDARVAIIPLRQGGLLVWDTRSGHVKVIARHSLEPWNWRHATTPDGALVLAAGQAQPTRFWEVSSGRSRYTVPGPARWSTAVAISGDGQVVVLAYAHDEVRVLPVPSTEFRAPWSYARPRSAVQLADDAGAFDEVLTRAEHLASSGNHAAAADELRTARAIPGFARHPDLRARWAGLSEHGRRTGLLGVWPTFEIGNAGWVFTRPPTVALADDGALYLTGGSDGYVRAWQGTEIVHTFPERSGMANSITIGPRGDYAVSSSNDGTVRVWNFHSGRCELVLDSARAFTLTGDRVLAGHEDGTLRLWDITSGRLLQTLPGHGAKVESVAVSPDGEYAAAVSKALLPPTPPSTISDTESDLRLFRLTTGELLHSQGCEDEAKPRFSPDSSRLMLAGGTQASVWSLPDMRQRYWFLTAFRSAVGLGADWRLGVAEDPFAGGIVFDVSTGGIVRTFGGKSIAAAVVSPDSRWAVTGGFDRVLRIWDLVGGKCVRELTAHQVQVSDIAWTPDGTSMITGDLSPAICGWALDWDFDFGPADPVPTAPARDPLPSHRRRWFRRG